MSDNLRTRIATAIYMQEYPKRCEHCPTPHPSPWAYKVADAVIEALKLEVEDGECGYCQAQLPGCRYVTEWIPNE